METDHNLKIQIFKMSQTTNQMKMAVLKKTQANNINYIIIYIYI